MLLVHSVNAAGSACEMRPLFERHRAHRAVYALDLPGFGFSERSGLPYSPRLMTDAVLAMLDYESLALPVWVAHGRRGDFTDYRLLRRLADRINWIFDVFDTGALPHFKVADEFDRRYRRFLDDARGRGG